MGNDNYQVLEIDSSLNSKLKPTTFLVICQLEYTHYGSLLSHSLGKGKLTCLL